MTKGIERPYQCSDIEPVEKDITFDDCIFRSYTWYAPKDKWKGRVIFIHGYRDSHDFYYELGETIAKEGFDFFFFYQRGEGESKLTDNTQGVTNDHYAYKAIDDMILYNVAELEKQKLPPTLHLMGLSMGGGLTLSYACHGPYREKIQSFAAIAPLIVLHKDTNPGKILEWAVRAICLFDFGKQLRVSSPLKSEYIAGDPQYKEYLESITDTNGLQGAFVETRDFILRGRRLLNKEIYSQVDPNVPLVILHGDDDHINSYAASAEWINSVNGIHGMKNKQLLSYKNGKHNLVIDIPEIRNRVISDLVHFLHENECASDSLRNNTTK